MGSVRAPGRYFATWRGRVLGGEPIRKQWLEEAESAVVTDWLLGQPTRYATPAFTVLADAGSQTSLSTWAFTASAGAPVGAVIVAAIYINSNVSAVTSFTDTAGNTWTLRAQQTSNAAQLFVYTSTLTAAIAGGDSFTVTMPFAQNRFAATVFRVEGAASSTPQGSALNSGAATTTPSAGPSSPNLDPALPRSVVVGVFGAQSGTADTVWSSTTPIGLVSQGGTSGATSSNRQVAAAWNVDYSIGDGASSRATSSISSAFAAAVLVFPLAVATPATNVDGSGTSAGSSSVAGSGVVVAQASGTSAGSSSVSGAPVVVVHATGSTAGSSVVTATPSVGVAATGATAGSSVVAGTGVAVAPTPVPATGDVVGSSVVSGGGLALTAETPAPAPIGGAPAAPLAALTFDDEIALLLMLAAATHETRR